MSTVVLNSTPASIKADDARRRLILAVGAGLIVCAAVTALLLALSGSVAWWQGFFAASIASVLAAAGSIAAVMIGLRSGPAGLIAGFLASTAVRFVISLGVASFAILVGNYPRVPTLILVLPYYAVTLFAEVWALARLQSNLVPNATPQT